MTTTLLEELFLELELTTLEIETKEEQARALLRDVVGLQAEQKALRKQIDDIKKGGVIRVSDHALVRYLERIQELDMNQIREQILTDETQAQIKAFGDGAYPIRGGGLARVKDKTIITIL